jgi:ABC-type multidrug transport system permease subunit
MVPNELIRIFLITLYFLKYGKVIENSDVTLIWVFMMSYTVATINFSFLVSTFFTRANSAAAAGKNSY